MFHLVGSGSQTNDLSVSYWPNTLNLPPTHLTGRQMTSLNQGFGFRENHLVQSFYMLYLFYNSWQICWFALVFSCCIFPFVTGLCIERERGRRDREGERGVLSCNTERIHRSYTTEIHLHLERGRHGDRKTGRRRERCPVL